MKNHWGIKFYTRMKNYGYCSVRPCIGSSLSNVSYHGLFLMHFRREAFPSGLILARETNHGKFDLYTNQDCLRTYLGFYTKCNKLDWSSKKLLEAELSSLAPGNGWAFRSRTRIWTSSTTGKLVKPSTFSSRLVGSFGSGSKENVRATSRII